MSELTLPGLNTSLRLSAITFRQASRMSEPHVLCSGFPVHVPVPVPVHDRRDPTQSATRRRTAPPRAHQTCELGAADFGGEPSAAIGGGGTVSKHGEGIEYEHEQEQEHEGEAW